MPGSGTFATAASTCHAFVAAISADPFEPLEASADLVEHTPGPVAFLDRG